MASSLSNLVNNLSEGIHKIKCKYGHDDIKYCDCFLEYTNFKDDLIELKCLCCNESYKENLDENLKERFFLIYTNFLTMIAISLFYCCENAFTLMNIWMIEKHS